MTRLFIFTCAVSFAALANAGVITGTVSAQGKAQAQGGAAGGKYDSRQYKFVEKVNYAELRDFVVFIEGPVTNAVAITNTLKTVLTQKLTQKDATFQPHVLPIYAGTTVEWPNKDDILHNVFSDSPAKRFDLELYKGNPPGKAVQFDQPGRVDVFCSIHSQMHCIVLVLENPHFASTDSKGRYTIADVPAGTYKLKAWHERMPAQVKEITVPASGGLTVDFTLGITNLPKY